MTDTLKRTPLYEIHKALGGKMVPFAGWEMPVQYPAGIINEHKAVRTDAGIFDVSHMGEIEVTGPDRNAFVNRMTTNDVGALEAGEVQYSAVLSPEGTFLDDCTVYRFDDKIMVVVNASNADRIWNHFVEHKKGANIRLKNISNDVGLLALQGPRAEALLQAVSETHLPGIAYYHHTTGKVAGCGCFISRTGYTGEDGFELYCRWKDTETLWNALTGPGKAQPIGLGARDSLRLEMGYALYGHEIDENATPLEAGLGWIVKLDKGSPFTGAEALRRQKQHGVSRRMVGFTMSGKTFPRQGYPVFFEGNQVDVVRSGTVSPSLGIAIGTTYLPVAAAKAGTKFQVEVRGEKQEAEVVKMPFYRNGSVKKAK
jgi:aminomethyltransferase